LNIIFVINIDIMNK